MSVTLNKIMFIFMNFLSIILGLSSNSFFGLWMMMELNMMTFIMLMILFKSVLSYMSVLNYFLPQALASTTFFFSFLMIMKFNEMSYLIMLMSMVIKMGMAPFHFWFIRISTQVSKPIFFLLSITQKILPMFFIMTLHSLNILIFIFFTAMISISSIMYQSQMMTIMAFSSLFSSSWALSSISFLSAILFILIYSSVLLMFLMLMSVSGTEDLSQSSSVSLFYIMTLTMTMLTFMGMPPTLGFLAKTFIISEMITYSTILPISLILMSVLFFFVYLKICLLPLSAKNKTFFFTKNNNYIFMMTLFWFTPLIML